MLPPTKVSRTWIFAISSVGTSSGLRSTTTGPLRRCCITAIWPPKGGYASSRQDRRECQQSNEAVRRDPEHHGTAGMPRDASAEDVLEAMHAVQAGEAVCPGALCALLFRFFEREATSVHSATLHPRLGLTRREQQIVPLIAQGLTNKEIANRFCLSEQTVKNHLYRMKHKVGAGDRFGIVHLCRTQGFLV